MSADAQIVAVLDVRYVSNVPEGAARDARALNELNAQAGASQKAALVSGGSAATATEASALRGSKALSTLALYLGGAGTAAVLYGTHVAIGMDTAEKHVLAATNTSQAQIKKVEAATISLSNATGKSSTELMNSYYSIASSIDSTAKARAILTDATKFATAYDTENSVATGLLTGATNAYHLSLKQIPVAQDQLTQSVKIGAAEARDLAPALSEIIPIAAHLGIGLDQLGAYLATATNQGQSATIAGDDFRNMIQQLDAPTHLQILAVKALGGSYEDLRVHNGKLQPTLDRLNQLLKEAPPTLQDIADRTHMTGSRLDVFASQMSTADGRTRALFGGNQSAARAFFTQANDGFTTTNTNLQKMGDYAGATEHAFKVSMTAAGRDIDRATAALHNMALEIGQTVMPRVAALAGGFAEVGKKGSDLASQHETTINFLTDIGGEALAASLAIKALKYGFGDLKLALVALGVVGGIAAVGVAELTLGLELQHEQEQHLSAGLTELHARYAEGKITYEEYRDAMVRATEIMHGPMAAAIEKATLDHRHERQEIDKVTAAWKGALQARIDYENNANSAGGPGAPTSFPGFGGSGSPASNPALQYLQTQITAAGNEVTKWANIVAYDRDHNHAALAADTEELTKARQRAAELNKEWSDLTSTTQKHVAALSLHSAKLDAVTRAQDDYQKALNAVTADLAGPTHTATAEHIADLREAKKRLDDLNSAVSSILAPAKSVAISLNDLIDPLTAGKTGVGFFAGAIHDAIDPLNRLAFAAGKAADFMLAGPYGRPGDIGTNPEFQHPTPPIRPYGEDVWGNGLTGQGPSALGPGGKGGYTFTTGYPNGQITISGSQVYLNAVPGSGYSRDNLGALGGLNPSPTPGGAGQAPLAPGDNTAILAEVSSALSQQSQALSTASSLNASMLQVIAGEGQIQIDTLAAAVTAIQDQTSVIQAGTTLATALSNQQIAQVNGETSILQAIGAASVQSVKDQGAIAVDIKNGDAVKLQQDRQIAVADQKLSIDAILIARQHALIDQQNAATAVQAARDGLKQARDKAAVDAADAAAKFRVDVATLNVHTAEYQLAVDTATMTKDLVDLTGQLVQLAGGNPISGKMLADMGLVSKDSSRLSGAQNSLTDETVGQGIVNQQGQYTLANDALSAAMNAATGAATQQSLQSILAGLLQTQAGDQNQKNMLDALIQIATSLQQTNSTLSTIAGNTQDASTVAALEALIQTLRDTVRRQNVPGQRVRGSGSTLTGILAGLAASGKATG